MPKDNLEPIGVQAVAEGVSQFLNQMKQMEAAYNRVQASSGKFVSSANQGGGVVQRLGGAFSSLLSPLRGAQSAMGTFTTAMVGGAGLAVGMGVVRTAAGAMTGAIQLAGNAASAAVRGIVDLTMAASASEGIQNAFQVSAARSGIALEQLRAAAKGTIPDLELMRQTNVALTGAGNQLAKEFGESLPRLLEVARASARGTGQDAEFLFQSLVTGIKRTSPMLIDNTGLQLRLGAANESLAASMGKTVEELSAEERQIAILRATLQAGEGVIAQFGSDQLTAAESVAAARAQLANLGQTAGSVFQPALQTVASTIANFANNLNMAMQEGGALYPVIVNLGAAASLLADGFSSAVGSVLNSITAMQGGVNERLGSMTSDMFNWGVNLVASFAEGLANAIEAYVVPVIQALANILTGWFAPGSPPAILPKIDQWGAETINEWLNGMSQADFGALKKIQGVLKQVVGPETFKAASAKAMQALAGDTGALGELTSALAGEEGIHEKLSAYAGEITRLIELEVQLAQAEERAANASRNLSRVQDKLAVAASEYNQMLAEGASPEALAAKKASIKAMEDELELARRQNEEAQAGLGTLKDEAALQSDKVDAIMSLTEEEQKAAGIGAGVKAGAGKIAAPKLPKMPEVEDLAKELTEGMDGLAENIQLSTGKITDGIGNAIEAAKTQLKERVGGLFADIQARMSEAVGPLVSVFRDQLLPALTQVWDAVRVGVGQAVQVASQFWTNTLLPALRTVGDFIQTNVLPRLSQLWTWLQTNIPIAVQTAATWLQTNLPVAIQAASDFITTQAIPALSELWTWLQVNVPAAAGAAVTWLQTNIPLAIQAVGNFITTKLLPAIQALRDYFEPTFQRLSEAWAEVLVALEPLGPVLVEMGPIFAGLAEILGHLATAAGVVLVGAIKLLLETVAFVLPYVADTFVNMVTTATGVLGGLVEFINGAIDMIVALFTGDLDAARVGAAQVLTGLGQIFASVFQGIVGQVQPVIDIITDLLDKIGLLQSLGISTEFLTQPFDQAKSAIGAVGSQIGDFASKLAGIQPPAFLNPGSPTPFEIGLLGVATALTGPVQAGLALINQAVLTLNVTAMTTIQTILAALTNLVLTGIQPVDLALQFIRDQTIPTLLQTTINAATQTVMHMNLVKAAVDLVTAAVNTATAAFSALGSTAVPIGSAIAEAMNTARKEIDSLVKAVNKATEAFDKMEAAARAAAEAAKDAGSNAGAASPGAGFQHGTGAGGFVVPPGYPRDSFPLRVSSGERVFVQPRAQAQAPMQQRITNFYMTVNSGASPRAVVQQFEVMRALAGA